MEIYRKEEYEMVIGLEVHIQLNTLSKAFASDFNRFGSDPNTNISPITLAHPGTLPRANKAHLEKAIMLALATGAAINKYNQFDRKHYFYPDLPKGYQITQDKHPICTGGSINFQSGGTLKRVRLHHIHMEEDAGKSGHESSASHSFLDYNRAGTPLVEMVTEPDLRSGDEVHDFMEYIRKMVRYLGISDGNMEEGSMRCDCNVSIRKKGETALGERCEIKNVNSKKYARLAVEYEFERQLSILREGRKIFKQTLNFNPETGVTTPIREKEDAHDYRYFPDPDLPPIVLQDKDIREIQQQLPLLPEQYVHQLQTAYGLTEYDAEVLTQEKEYADYFIELANEYTDFSSLSKVIINKVLPLANESGVMPGEELIPKKRLMEFLGIIDSGNVSISSAYQILFPVMLQRTSDALEELAAELKILKSKDQGFVEDLVDQLLSAHPAELEKYKKGNKGLLGFFMGQAMKASQGKADPQILKQVLTSKLNS